MNKSRYIPFERNRYFYGKLLTVRDFMTEQTYYSDKRRLINRLLHGSGVVAGLQVVAVDDKSVSIETGAALDTLGREIVVPSPVTIKLSQLDGFTNNEYAKNVYLCIAYDEKGKEPVHTVAGAGTAGREGDVSEHNRILESYRLFISEQSPSPGLQEYDHLIEDTSVWYGDSQVRILQTAPRYLEPGQVFDLRLTVEKTLQTAHVEFEYVPDWTGFELADPLADGKIRFVEPTDGGQTVYKQTVRVRAAELEPGEVRSIRSIGAKAGTARLVVGDKLINELSRVQHSVEVSEEPAERRILRSFYSRSLDRALESTSDSAVCLAKINLLQMGATYVIDSIEPMPLQDYVINATMLYKILSSQGSITRGESAAGSVGSEPGAAPSAPPESFPDLKDEFRLFEGENEDQPKEEQAASGIVEISILPPPKKKWYHRRVRTFYSDEIPHGLGGGAAFISAGVSDEKEESEVIVPEMWSRSDAVYVGNQSIFKKSEYASELPQVEIGYIFYPKKGTFRIGVKVKGKTERTRLRLRWWAVKAAADAAADSAGDGAGAPLGEHNRGQHEAAAGRS
ncbi:hypothetical protein [Cohnella fermenti]|uniref:Uncharacterized protein n=1 Tax=Cohnella fermenti TaxID=2565925 RepID=A0A4S4BGM3_9BACL|nr:hypothetical protein [Cohnella fermenti]THF73391.1 hypothetical protein E6C55_29280 [Cohnella fermenti]